MRQSSRTLSRVCGLSRPSASAAAANATRGVARRSSDSACPWSTSAAACPPRPTEAGVARTIAGALGAVGFEGRLLAEPGARSWRGRGSTWLAPCGRSDACRTGRDASCVDPARICCPRPFALAARRRAARHRPIRRPGPDRGRAVLASQILHPRVERPAIAEGEVLLIRRVGAYNQSQSTQSGDLRPAVIARDRGEWRRCERRETIDDLIATDLGDSTCAHVHGTNGLRPDRAGCARQRRQPTEKRRL